MGDVGRRAVVTVVLDTCAIVWVVSDPGQLTARAVSLLEARDTEVCVSAISCAEIACAAERGRIAIDRHWRFWFRHYVELNGWTVLPVELESVEEAFALPEPFHRDPADRIIVAEARRRSAAVVTADTKILNYPHVKTVWGS
ncbi:MAG: type II toxin-antitoxin system VapC family toxin [Acidobacteria bacterium]|nr:type II toxin-antitoxin system VapC family toxin [Acidobacteriota bacterium]